MNTESHAFDPYHKWLGIAPKDQPANHYRLLGIDLFESDPDTIAHAADRQMGHVRSFQNGQNSQVSQRILNEMAAARVCLLNPAKKSVYDAELKERLLPRATPADNQRATPAVKRRQRSRMNPRTMILAAGAVAVCALVVVLLPSRSKPNVAKAPVVQQATHVRETPTARPGNEKEVQPKLESKQETPPQPKAEAQPEPKPEVSSPPKPEGSPEPKPEPKVKLGDFAGTWAIKYRGGPTRTYTIDSEGSVVFREEKRQGRLSTRDGKVLLDFSDGKLERLELLNSVLRVEHYSPASQYPDGSPLLGVGEKAEPEPRPSPAGSKPPKPETRVAGKAAEKPLPQPTDRMEADEKEPSASEKPVTKAKPAAKRTPARVLASLRKTLHAKVSYDAKTEQFALAYDWASKQQLEDFDLSKAKITFARGNLTLQAGESVRHVVDFKEVAIAVPVLVPQMRGQLIKTSGGASAFLGGDDPNGMYLAVEGGDKLDLIVPTSQRTGIQPVLVTIAPTRLAFAYGIGTPSRLVKPVTNFHAGQVELFGGSMGFQYGKLILAGVLDDKWVEKKLEE